MLVEKYIPKTFDELIGRDAIISDLKKFIAAPAGIPHLLFFGTTGVGKTSMVQVLKNELYGSKASMFFTEFNASDERGVDVIREKVIELCKRKPIGFSYRIIFMDEADGLTPEAQAIMNRTIEKYQSYVRFIYACNNVYKLIPANVSRLKKYEFTKIDDIVIAKYLKKICIAEDIKLEDKQIITVVKKTRGDIRAALNMLEGIIQPTCEEWESMTYAKLLSIPIEKRVELAFIADADLIFTKVWEMIQAEKKWQFLDLMADTQTRMNYAAIKSIFIANMLEKLK